MWVVLAVISAICLGLYDVSKKQALTGNTVMGVLLVSILCSCVLLLPFLLLSRFAPSMMEDSLFYVPQVDWRTHLYIWVKAAIVLASWVCAYFAMKNLPITIVTPVNATRPMWTLVGAVIIFGETLNAWQWAGVVVAIASFYAFSVLGKLEGIRWTHNRWGYALLLAVLLGAASGLYDKYLMRQFDHMAVQVYYTFYQAVLMTAVWAIGHVRNAHDEQALRAGASHKAPSAHTHFHWSWWVMSISVFLVVSDFVYFVALSDPDSLISVVSTIRRSGVVVSFAYGALVLHDQNPKRKSLCLLGVIVGMILLLIGSLGK